VEEHFPSWAYLAVFLTASAASAGTSRFWINRAKSWGLLDNPGHRKIHSEPIPLAGGLIVATGLLLPLFAGIGLIGMSILGPTLTELSTYGLSERTVQLGGLVIGAIGMLGLGLYDDRTPLSAGKKLAIQFLIAMIVASTGTRITLFVPNLLFSYAITILWFLMLVNAFNFTDNMNGLCTGLGAISAFILSVHSAIPEHYLVASLGFLVAGSLFGFLPSNYPKAKTFLGDSGSHLVGYLIAALAILPHFHHGAQPNKFGVISPLLILGVVFVDLCWVVGYRLWHGKPIYIGDTNHLSHQLVKRGFPATQAVLILWCLHAAIAASSFFLI
jgi:UDP-GlcNAc:undecaprenyl-phosphate/decaprenyl-phosphate GlcNAc-1-phosphate transferase